jgi:transposase
MLTDKQFSRIKPMRAEGKTQQNVADILNVSRSTVIKYENQSIPPSEMKDPRDYTTRPCPYVEVWDEVCGLLALNRGLKPKTIFEHLQRTHVGKFQDGQKRTLERRIKSWKMVNGPFKDVVFSQNHYPGDLGASDYTKMGKLDITIQGQEFEHILYHFVLTYSNWETVSICYGETFESLSEGFQNAMWELGGVPQRHRTDNLGAAVINMGDNKGEMTKRYMGLLDHYGMDRSKIQPGKPNENGDVERSNGLLKTVLDQRLMLRGSRDFENTNEYDTFLKNLMRELNAGRTERFKEDKAKLKPLPSKRQDACTRFDKTVSHFSTVNLAGMIYSVSSRLVNDKIMLMQYSSWIELWSGAKRIDVMPRSTGKKVTINYRHIIHSLLRKPGAFEGYKYRDELFPTSHFREAYDNLLEHRPSKAVKEYLHILELAATLSETSVDSALQELLSNGGKLSLYEVTEMVTRPHRETLPDVVIDPVNLETYDQFINRSQRGT